MCPPPSHCSAETKRSEFPRFYFVSDPTLLEILSLGSDPPAVVPHFQSGLFDSLSNVTFDKVGGKGVVNCCIESALIGGRWLAEQCGIQQSIALALATSALPTNPTLHATPPSTPGGPHQDAGDVQPGGRVRAL